MVNISIFNRVFVTLRAVSLPLIVLAFFCDHVVRIVFVRAKKQMSGVAAVPVVAPVEHAQVCGDRSVR
jgi:hypothetical protein